MSEKDTADFAAREQQINDASAALEERQKKLDEREAKARRDDAADFADGLVKAGQLLPKDKAPVVELLLALPTAAPLSFASGDDTIEKPAAELFRELLGGMPKRMDFSEKSAGNEAVGTDDANEIAKRALEFQASESKAGREISVSTAVQHITSEGSR